ncbi:hypothetical protein WDU94_012789 [Cyamophila willieti]
MCCKSTLGSILVFILFHSSTCDIPEDLFKKFECEKNNGCEKPLYNGIMLITYNHSWKGSRVQVYAEKNYEILVKTENGHFENLQKEAIRRSPDQKENFPRSKNSRENVKKNEMHSNNVKTSPSPSRTQNIDTSTSSIKPSQMPDNLKVDSSIGPVKSWEYNDGPGVEELEDGVEDDISIGEDDSKYHLADLVSPSKTKLLEQNLPLSDNLVDNGQTTQLKTPFPDHPNSPIENMTATYNSSSNSDLSHNNLSETKENHTKETGQESDSKQDKSDSDQELDSNQNKSVTGQELDSNQTKSESDQELDSNEKKSVAGQELGSNQTKSKSGQEFDSNQTKSESGQQLDSNQTKSVAGQELDSNQIKSKSGQELDSNQTKSVAGQELDSNQTKSVAGQELDSNQTKSESGQELDSNQTKSVAGQELDSNQTKSSLVKNLIQIKPNLWLVKNLIQIKPNPSLVKNLIQIKPNLWLVKNLIQIKSNLSLVKNLIQIKTNLWLVKNLIQIKPNPSLVKNLIQIKPNLWLVKNLIQIKPNPSLVKNLIQIKPNLKLNSNQDKSVAGQELGSNQTKSKSGQEFDSNQTKSESGQQLDSNQTKSVAGQELDQIKSESGQELDSNQTKSVAGQQLDSNQTKSVAGQELDQIKSESGQELDSNQTKSVAGQELDSNQTKSESGQELDSNQTKSVAGQELDSNQTKSKSGQELDSNQTKSVAGQELDSNQIKSESGQELDSNQNKSKSGQELDSNQTKSVAGQELDSNQTKSESGQELDSNQTKSESGQELDSNLTKSVTGQKLNTKDKQTSVPATDTSKNHVEGKERADSGTDASSNSRESEKSVTNLSSQKVETPELLNETQSSGHAAKTNHKDIAPGSQEKPLINESSNKNDSNARKIPSSAETNTKSEIAAANTSSSNTVGPKNETETLQNEKNISKSETIETPSETPKITTTFTENIDKEKETKAEEPIIEKSIDINDRNKHSWDQIYKPPTLPPYLTTQKDKKTDENLSNLDSIINGENKKIQESDKSLPSAPQQKPADTQRTHLPLETKDAFVVQDEISKSVNSNEEQSLSGGPEDSYFTETYNNLNLDILSDYISSNEIFKDYPSSLICLNTVLFLLLLLLLNCLSVRKCDNVIKGKLYMCEKKLLEHTAETFKIQEMLQEQSENSEHFIKLQSENELQKSSVNMLTQRINELEESEITLKESLSEFKSKYETLEEVSSKKSIKKNYEKLMDQVKVQKNKLDELAATMEERAEVLRKEKENIESLLKVQAEEHNKVVNDYRMLLNNVELENKELREIVQTMSVDSDTSEKLLEAVKLQVQLSDLEKECQNLHHQLEGEREAHKLLEDHQRMTQKEVNDLRESCEIAIKEKADISNKLKYITDYFQQLEDKLKKEIADKDELINEKLGDDDSLAKALMNLRKENCVLNEENNILRAKYDSLKVELTDQKNEEKIAKTKLESEREQIWMDWRAAERKIESLNLDNKVLRSKLVALGSKSETSFRDMHTQTYDDPDKMLSPTSSLFLDHTSPVPQQAFFIPNYAIPPPPLSDDEMRQMYGSNRNYNENGYHTDDDHEHSYDHRLPPLGGTFSPPTLDNIPVPNIPPPLDNEELWKRQTWNSQDVSSNEEEPSTLHNSYSRRRTGDSLSSVSSSKRSFV